MNIESDIKKNILVLGASRYYAKAIKAASDAGYNIIAVDRNPDSPGFKFSYASEVCDIIDSDGLISIAKRWGGSAIVPLNDYGVLAASIASMKLGLVGISPESAELATKKALMRKKWSEDGISCPPFEIATTRDDIKKAVQNIGVPCILKPAIGCGGASRGVIVVRSEKEIEESVSFSLSFYEDHTTLVEGFVDAVSEHSAEVLVYGGKAYVIAIGDKIKTPLPYRVDKDVLYPSNIYKNKDRLINVQREISKAVKSLGVHVGAAHIEFAITECGEIVFFEMGARCGGGGTSSPIVPYVTGVEIFVELVRILSGEKPHNLTPVMSNGCCYHFITPLPGKVRSISGSDAMKNSECVLDAEFFFEVESVIPPVTVGTERSGFIIAGGKDLNHAYENALKAEKCLKVNLY